MKVVYPAKRWENVKPEKIGLSSSLIQNVAAHARSRESPIPHDFSGHAEKWGEIIGSVPKERGAPNGLVIRNGYVAAEWGDTDRVDLSFSVTKSFLSTTVGLAWAEGLIEDIDDHVGPYLPPILLPAGDGEPGHEAFRGLGASRPVNLFESEHNRQIKDTRKNGK